jgi:UDP-N-acetylmuramoyl-L-alanyl-D-glutamate--2,6-diaminopimelate ligase
MTSVTVPRPIPRAPWAADFETWGVTGTNGKTSSVWMLTSVLRAAGRSPLTISTLGTFHEGRVLPRGKGDYASFLESTRVAIGAGARSGAFEATSLALERGYAMHWRFDHALFTNLSPDHLKTHGSYERYLAAKAQLFVHLGPGHVGCLNAGDPHAEFITRAAPADIRRVTFHAPKRGPAWTTPTLAATRIDVTLDGTTIHLADGEFASALGPSLHVPLVGEVFGENALGVATLAFATGIDAAAIRDGLAASRPVPGRFEVVARSPVVVVDYAHEADGLVRTLQQARALTRGRVIAVFGAGGDASEDKRAPMGEAAANLAHLTIVTSDNPRSEAPERIASMIEAGLAQVGDAKFVRELDRRRAIALALDEARPDDLVVIAGKGHERGQLVGRTKLPFHDPSVVRELLGIA